MMGRTALLRQLMAAGMRSKGRRLGLRLRGPGTRSSSQLKARHAPAAVLITDTNIKDSEDNLSHTGDTAGVLPRGVTPESMAHLLPP